MADSFGIGCLKVALTILEGRVIVCLSYIYGIFILYLSYVEGCLSLAVEWGDLYGVQRYKNYFTMSIFVVCFCLPSAEMQWAKYTPVATRVPDWLQPSQVAAPPLD